jgi:hypothetical protein
MRALLPVAWVCLLAAAGCNQDYAASNSDRQPFMEGRGVASSAPSASASAATSPAPASASGAPAPSAPPAH